MRHLRRKSINSIKGTNRPAYASLILQKIETKGGGSMILNMKTNDMQAALQKATSMYDKTFQVM